MPMVIIHNQLWYSSLVLELNMKVTWLITLSITKWGVWCLMPLGDPWINIYNVRSMDKYIQCIERIVEIRKTVLSSFTVNM